MLCTKESGSILKYEFNDSLDSDSNTISRYFYKYQNIIHCCFLKFTITFVIDLNIVIHSLKITDTGEQGDKDHEISKKTPISVGEQNGGTQASRNVSCVADTNSQREVVVECFAPYDDHR